MSVMRLWMKYFFHHTPGHFVIGNVVILNYNKFKLLIFIKKIEEFLSTRSCTWCSEASFIEKAFMLLIFFLNIF